jgi:hypothetical protein
MAHVHATVLVKIFLANLGITLLLGTIREQIVGIWNPHLDMTLAERIVFAIRPMTTAAIVVLAAAAFFWIARLLRPLFRYLESGVDYAAARHAAIRIPWVLLVLHVGGWAIGTFVLYAFVFNWASPGGITFFWSLMISLSTGVVTGIFAALAINALLLDAKQQMGMTEIRDGELDRFVKSKDYWIFFSTIYRQTVQIAHVWMFYMAGIELPMKCVPGTRRIALQGGRKSHPAEKSHQLRRDRPPRTQLQRVSRGTRQYRAGDSFFH